MARKALLPGLKRKYCKKHRMSYYFYCYKCYDPMWETPIPLRVNLPADAEAND